MRLPVPPPCAAMGILLGVIGIVGPPHATSLLLAASGLGLGLLYQQNRRLRAEHAEPSAPAERRSAPRVQPSHTDELRASVLIDGAEVPAEVIDISAGGARLRLPCIGAPPDTLRLVVYLGDQGLAASGVVRWRGCSEGDLLVGVAFERGEDSALPEAIGAWIRARVARQARPVTARLAG